MINMKYRGENVTLHEPNENAKIKIPRNPPTIPALLDAENLHRGTVAIDVGAYVGIWSNELVKYYDKVIAIEPNPPAFNKLVERSKENIDCIEAGVGERCTRGRMLNPKKRGTPTSMMVDYDAHGSVKVITLDSLNIQDQVGLIKIDVEGAEHLVLQGAEDLIGRDHPILVLEMCDERFGEKHIDEVQKILDGWGYKWVMATGVDHVFL